MKNNTVRLANVAVIWVAALVAWGVYLAPPAAGCSVGPGFLWLSNYELVKKADDIVLARATSTRPGEFRERIGFTVLKSLKGRCREKSVFTSGTTDPKSYSGPSRDDDFGRARPGTYAGACEANDYQIGKTYLLFLHHFLVPPGYPLQEGWVVGERVWQVGIAILSRDREEVSETGSAWVQAVEHYLAIDRLNDYEKEKTALRTLRAQAAAATTHQNFPAALVADIDRHFATISPLKSYADLMALYDAGDARQRDSAVHALAQSFEPRAFAFIREHFRDNQWIRHWLRYLRGVEHPQRLQEVEQLWNKWLAPAAGYEPYAIEDIRREIADVLTVVASTSDYAVMARVVKTADLKEASGRTIVRWFALHASPGALQAIKEIVGADYKSSALLTTLVTLGDEEVVRWAVANAANNGFLLAAIMAHSPTALADVEARRLINQGDMKDLEAMIQVYTDTYTAPNQNPHRWDRLRDIIAMPNKSDRVIGALRSTLQPAVTKHTPDFARFEELRKLLETQLATEAAATKP